MTEREALALVRQHARRRRWFFACLLVAFFALPVVVQLGLPVTSAWPWERPVESLVYLVLWLPIMWLFFVRPARASLRRLTELNHVVHGRIVRLRVGFVTVDVPDERPREWQLGRRAKRLHLGDEVWLDPGAEDDKPIVAVCVPREGSPFVVTDVPGIYTSLR